MHDELSALIRAQANSISELIYKVKTTDVHPVGVSLFVHYWSFWFGNSEMVMKFPFILFGLISIFYSYKIAEKWFNPTVAILTITFLATLQFPIMYGQLERPYASGMLFSVLMAWCWTNFFFDEEKKQIKNLIGFIISASLCTYNHYFSLLFAAVVGITGLFFLTKKNAILYLTACFSIVILFLPTISILFYHLSHGNSGGESWLSKPQPNWLYVFFQYLFHYSKLVYLLIAVLLAGSIYYYNTNISKANKMRLIAIVWALLVPSLAYYYSIHKTPVLQFSTFSFSLPFLFMFIFSLYRELEKPIKTLIVLTIICVNTFTLVAARKHYTLLYHQPYDEMAKMSTETINEYGPENVKIALGTVDGFVNYYFNKYKLEFYFYRADNAQTKPFINFLADRQTDYFVAGNLPLEYYQIIKEKYPFIVKKAEGFTFSVYCFSKIRPQNEIKEKVTFSETQLKDIFSGHWDKNYIGQEFPNHPGETDIKLDSEQEYSSGFSAKLKDIIKSRHSILNVSADMAVFDERSNPSLVISIQEGKKIILWRGSELKSFRRSTGNFTGVYVANLFTDMEIQKYPNAEMIIYIWNRTKKEVWVKNFKIEVIESNPNIYGLYEPLD